MNHMEPSHKTLSQVWEFSLSFDFLTHDINLLLTERKGRTGWYRPDVMAVRTSLRSVRRTKTTEGQFSKVRLG